MNLDCSVVSCVLQSPNQTRVNVNFSSPAGAVEERADAEGTGAVAPAGSRPGRSCRSGGAPGGTERVPGVPAPRRRQRPARPGLPQPSLPRRARLRCRRRRGRRSRRGGGGAETCGRVYCCRLAPSSVFLHAVTRQASFPLLSRKPQPRYHISEAIVCAHHQNRHSFRLKKCYCATKKERTGFMLFGADEKDYVKSPNVRKISCTQVQL